MGRKPPKDFAKWEPLIAKLPKGSLWYRSHQLVHAPMFFGRDMTQRWDAPTAEYGVLYMGENPECAFMESIGRSLLRTRMVPATTLEARGLSEVVLRSELRLIDLVSSSGLTKVGAEGSISNGLGYKTSQAWSLAFHDHPEEVDGILYRSRHDPERVALALFDRCENALAVNGPPLSWLSQAALLAQILDLYGFGIDP